MLKYSHPTLALILDYWPITIFLPAILPTLIVALIFKSILHPSNGILNQALRSVGLVFRL